MRGVVLDVTVFRWEYWGMLEGECTMRTPLSFVRSRYFIDRQEFDENSLRIQAYAGDLSFRG